MSDPAFEAIKKARNQDQGGNPEGAAKTLEDYLATDPYNVPPRMELARIYNYSLKNRKMALIQLDMILDFDPDNVDALKASTTIKMLDKAKTEEADAEFKRLITLVSESKDPKDFAAVCAVYAVFQRKQKVDFEKAAEYYEKAIAACPDMYEYHQDYAVLLLNDIKDYVKAKHELEEVMRLRPNSDTAKKNYDILMKKKFDKNGNLKRSLRDRLRHH